MANWSGAVWVFMTFYLSVSIVKLTDDPSMLKDTGYSFV
jgi:hypothetical protein